MKKIFTILALVISSLICFSQNNAAVFNGTSTSMESAEGQSGDGTVGGMNLNLGSFTMETWIKFNNPGSANINNPLPLDVSNPQTDWIAEVGSTAYGINTWFWFNNADTYKYGYNKMHIGFSGASGGSIPRDGTTGGGDFTYDFTPVAGTWYHVAYTYNSVDKTLNFFVNGVSKGIKTNTGQATPTSVARPKLTLGKRIFGGVTSHFLDGSMDEFRLWNKARTAAEINADMTKELSGNEANLVAYYKFDEPTTGALCSAIDCSPQRFDALNGGTTRVVSTAPLTTDVACGADPAVLGVNEFIGRYNGACPINWDSDANWSLGHIPTPIENVLIRHGRVSLINNSQIIAINNLTLDGASAAVINGDAPRLDIINNFIWKSGTMSTYFRTLGLGNSIEDIRVAKKYYTASWDNVGKTAWGAKICMDNGSISNLGTFNVNIPLGEGYTEMISQYGGLMRDFYNQSSGTLNIINANTGYIGGFLGTNFYNNGIIVNSGLSTVDFNNLTNTGQLIMPLGGGIYLNGGTINSGTTISGNGGIIELGPPTVSVNTALNPNNNRMEINTSANVTGIGSITTNNTFNFHSGTLGIPLTIGSGGTLNLGAATNDRVIASAITNNGTTNWSSSNIKFQNGTFQNNGTFNINLTTAGTMSEISGINKLENCGTINNKSNTTIGISYQSCQAPGMRAKFNGIGTVTFTIPPDLSNTDVSPNNSPGTLVIDPLVTSTASTVYIMEITGGYNDPSTPADDPDNDLLQSTGNIVLGGTLKLILNNNPVSGTYTIFNSTSGSVTGTFSSIQYSLNGSPFSSTPPAGVNIVFNSTNVQVVYSAPLPIELLSFKAQYTEGGNLLTWQTASEINTSHFDIERSNDGIKFNKIGELKAQNKAANYNYLDKAPFGGWGAYYRLTINDLDGKKNVSKIVSIENKSDKSIKITRNTEGSILIETNNQIELITITNTIGQVIKSTKDNPFLMNDLNAGTYIISVKTDKGFLSHKIFKN